MPAASGVWTVSGGAVGPRRPVRSALAPAARRRAAGLPARAGPRFEQGHRSIVRGAGVPPTDRHAPRCNRIVGPRVCEGDGRPEGGHMTDNEDFDAFYLGSRTRLVHQMYAMTGDLGAAQDAAQEAYARAWQRWSRLRDYDDPEAWVRTVAWRLVVSRWRTARNAMRAHRRQAVAESTPEPSPDTRRPGLRAAPPPGGPATGHRPAPPVRPVRRGRGPGDRRSGRHGQGAALQRTYGAQRPPHRSPATARPPRRAAMSDPLHTLLDELSGTSTGRGWLTLSRPPPRRAAHPPQDRRRSRRRGRRSHRGGAARNGAAPLTRGQDRTSHSEPARRASRPPPRPPPRLPRRLRPRWLARSTCCRPRLCPSPTRGAGGRWRRP